MSATPKRVSARRNSSSQGERQDGRLDGGELLFVQLVSWSAPKAANSLQWTSLGLHAASSLDAWIVGVLPVCTCGDWCSANLLSMRASMRASKATSLASMPMMASSCRLVSLRKLSKLTNRRRARHPGPCGQAGARGRCRCADGLSRRRRHCARDLDGTALIEPSVEPPRAGPPSAVAQASPARTLGDTCQFLQPKPSAASTDGRRARV